MIFTPSTWRVSWLAPVGNGEPGVDGQYAGISGFTVYEVTENGGSRVISTTASSFKSAAPIKGGSSSGPLP